MEPQERPHTGHTSRSCSCWHLILSQWHRQKDWLSVGGGEGQATLFVCVCVGGTAAYLTKHLDFVNRGPAVEDYLLRSWEVKNTFFFVRCSRSIISSNNGFRLWSICSSIKTLFFADGSRLSNPVPAARACAHVSVFEL